MIANYTGTGSRGSFTFKRNVLLPEERLSLRSQTIASLIMSETTEKPAISTSLVNFN